MILTKHIFKIQLVILLIIGTCVSFSACSKKDNDGPKPEAIVQDWIQPTFSHIAGRPVYFCSNTDARITDDIIKNGRVLAYIGQITISSSNSYNYFKMNYAKDGTEFKFSLTNNEIAITTNVNPNINPQVAYTYCYIILPKGYQIPPDLDENDFKQVAAHFNISPEFGVSL